MSSLGCVRGGEQNTTFDVGSESALNNAINVIDTLGFANDYVIETDMLMRDSNTGAFELFDISNNAITSMGPMGQVGPEWSVSGIAASSTTSAPAAQFTQAMASFVPGGGALANGTVLGQQPASSMAAGLLAAPSSQPTVSV